MLCKYFGAGASSSGAVEYVTKNETAKILYGNPEFTKDLIKNNTNKLKYRSGVLSFGTDRPNRETVNKIISEFENSTFAGLKEEQYNILWVEHNDTENYHIHFVIPRLELSTMKAFNPHYHKQDQKRLLKLQAYINSKYELQNPFSQDKRHTLEIKLDWKNRNQAKEQIDSFICKNIGQGKIENRNELVELLREQGLEVKESKKYIAIKSQDDKKFIRLKGAYYNESFADREGVGKLLKSEEQENRANTPKQLRELREEITRLTDYKAKQVIKQYGNGNIKDTSRVKEIESTKNSSHDISTLDSNIFYNGDNNLHSTTKHIGDDREVANNTNKNRISGFDKKVQQPSDRLQGAEQTNSDIRKMANSEEYEDRGQIGKIYQEQGRPMDLQQERSRPRPKNNTNRRLKENDSIRTAITRSLREYNQQEQTTFTTMQSTRDRIQKQYEGNGKTVDSNVKQYNKTAERTQSENEQTARNSYYSKFRLSDSVRSFTERFREFKNKVINKIREIAKPKQRYRSQGHSFSW